MTKPKNRKSDYKQVSENTTKSKASASPQHDTSLSSESDVEKREENRPKSPRRVHFESGSKNTWKKLIVFALVAGTLAALSQLEVGDKSEQLLVEKGVALLVNRPVVFKYIAELNNYKKWYPGIADFKPRDATPMGLGKQFTEVINIPFFGEMKYDNIVVGYESPRYISFLSDSWLKIRVEMEVVRRDSDKIPTSLKYRVFTTTSTAFEKYMALPCVRLMYNNRVRQAMFNIRFVFAK